MSRLRRRRALRTAVVTGYFALWFAGLVPLGWVVVPAAWLAGRGDRSARTRRAQRALGAACRTFVSSTRLARLVHFEPDRAVASGAPLPQGACVVVANHPSLIDVLVVLAAWPELCVMARRSLYASALLGPLQACCGHIVRSGRTAEAGAQAYAEARARLEAGHAVLIFAEGTRSPPGGLGRFSKGAFRLALEAGVPLVPLAITCTPPALGRGAPLGSFPLESVRMEVHRLETVPAEVARERGPRALMREVHRRIAARLGTLAAAAATR